MFTSTGGFGTSVKVGGIDINAVFSNGSDPANNGSAGFEATQPALLCETADIPVGTTDGTAVIANGSNYRVAEIHNDGSGMSVIELKK